MQSIGVRHLIEIRFFPALSFASAKKYKHTSMFFSGTKPFVVAIRGYNEKTRKKINFIQVEADVSQETLNSFSCSSIRRKLTPCRTECIQMRMSFLLASESC